MYVSVWLVLATPLINTPEQEPPFIVVIACFKKEPLVDNRCSGFGSQRASRDTQNKRFFNPSF